MKTSSTLASVIPIQLGDAARSVNTELERFYTNQQRNAQTMHPSYGELWRQLHDLHMSGGKRLRPYLTLLAYQAYTTRSVETIIPVAAAQELLHFAMLIHDDIIDRDTMRYGTDNMIGRYELVYAPVLKQPDERRHFANSAALLAGDLCLVGAFDVSANAELNAEQHMLVRRTLWQQVATVVGGELLDTEAAFRNAADTADAATINRYKTADYTCVRPLVLGAELAGASQTDLQLLEQLGTHLGIAFQLADDLLGVYGDSPVTGKPVGADIREGKRTYLVEQALHYANNVQQERLHILHGKVDITPVEVVEFCQLLEETGAVAAAHEQIADHRRAADGCIDALSIAPDFAEKFHMIAQFIVERKA